MERNPILTEEINFTYSKGKYDFYTKSVAKLVAIAFVLLQSCCETLADFARLVSCLWIVNHNANKLEGISSISSSVYDNCFCKAWRNMKDCICRYCYSHNQQSYQTGLKEHSILNGIILRNILIPVKAFKMGLKIIYKYLRIESFGDVANIVQARNYIRIIKAFPQKRCAIWTKNYRIWLKAFEIEGKPNNTTFVVSSPILNKPIELTEEEKTLVDHVFTVYTKEFAKKNGIIINCGGRKCMECIKAKKACYYRNTEFYINELKK